MGILFANKPAASKLKLASVLVCGFGVPDSVLVDFFMLTHMGIMSFSLPQ